MDGKAKGKGPGTKSGDGPAAGPAGPAAGPKGGKGKGAGRGKGQTLTKPEIKPTKAMKPLWWRRLLLGADIKSGAIWEKVSDQTRLLPIEKMEARFGKVQTAKPAAETETAQAAQVIRISAVHERELRLLPPPMKLVEVLWTWTIAWPLMSWSEFSYWHLRLKIWKH